MTVTQIAVPVVALIALFPAAPASADVRPVSSPGPLSAGVSVSFGTRCTTVPVPGRWRPAASATPSATRAAVTGDRGASRTSSAGLARVCRVSGVPASR